FISGRTVLPSYFFQSKSPVMSLAAESPLSSPPPNPQADSSGDPAAIAAAPIPAVRSRPRRLSLALTAASISWLLSLASAPCRQSREPGLAAHPGYDAAPEPARSPGVALLLTRVDNRVACVVTTI